MDQTQFVSALNRHSANHSIDALGDVIAEDHITQEDALTLLAETVRDGALSAVAAVRYAEDNAYKNIPALLDFATRIAPYADVPALLCEGVILNDALELVEEEQAHKTAMEQYADFALGIHDNGLINAAQLIEMSYAPFLIKGDEAAFLEKTDALQKLRETLLESYEGDVVAKPVMPEGLTPRNTEQWDAWQKTVQASPHGIRYTMLSLYIRSIHQDQDDLLRDAFRLVQKAYDVKDISINEFYDYRHGLILKAGADLKKEIGKSHLATLKSLHLAGEEPNFSLRQIGEIASSEDYGDATRHDAIGFLAGESLKAYEAGRGMDLVLQNIHKRIVLLPEVERQDWAKKFIAQIENNGRGYDDDVSMLNQITEFLPCLPHAEHADILQKLLRKALSRSLSRETAYDLTHYFGAVEKALTYLPGHGLQEKYLKKLNQAFERKQINDQQWFRRVTKNLKNLGRDQKAAFCLDLAHAIETMVDRKRLTADQAAEYQFALAMRVRRYARDLHHEAAGTNMALDLAQQMGASMSPTMASNLRNMFAKRTGKNVIGGMLIWVSENAPGKAAFAFSKTAGETAIDFFGLKGNEDQVNEALSTRYPASHPRRRMWTQFRACLT